VLGHEFPLEQAALGDGQQATVNTQQKPTPIADCRPPIATARACCLLPTTQTYPRPRGRAHTHPTVAARELAGRRRRGNGFALAERERRIPRGTAVYRRPRPVRWGRVEQPTMESGGACTQRRTAERMRLRFVPPEDQRAGRPFAPRSRLIAPTDTPAARRPVGALVCGASGRLDEGESEAPNKIRFRPALGTRVGSAKQNALPAGSTKESRKRPNKMRFRPALGTRVGSAKQNACCLLLLTRRAI
jgi:hypothetical protein